MIEKKRSSAGYTPGREVEVNIEGLTACTHFIPAVRLNNRILTPKQLKETSSTISGREIALIM